MRDPRGERQQGPPGSTGVHRGPPGSTGVHRGPEVIGNISLPITSLGLSCLQSPLHRSQRCLGIIGNTLTLLPCQQRRNGCENKGMVSYTHMKLQNAAQTQEWFPAAPFPCSVDFTLVFLLSLALTSHVHKLWVKAPVDRCKYSGERCSRGPKAASANVPAHTHIFLLSR